MIKCLAALCSLPSLYRKSLVTARNVKQMLTFVRHKNTRARARALTLTHTGTHATDRRGKTNTVVADASPATQEPSVEPL